MQNNFNWKKIIIPSAIVALAVVLVLDGQRNHAKTSFQMLSEPTQTNNEYAQYEPDPILSPGDVNPEITFEVLTSPNFTTKTYRSVSKSTKTKVYNMYHIYSYDPGQYEIDHIIPLELGGSNDIKNLWPQPYHGLWNAHVKDRLENKVNAMVRQKEITLQEAQQALSKDWVGAYKKYVDPNASGE